MEEIKFSSITELYNRLYPALTVKNNEFLLHKITSDQLEIWNYLKDNIWNKSIDLSLGEMVNDILTLEIEDFIKRKENR